MMPIHLVLDASAVIAYVRGSEDVGETLTQILENNAAFTAPMTALAVAASQADPALVGLLTKHEAFRPVELEWTRWRALAATLTLLRRPDAAEALLVTLDVNGHVLSGEPNLYAPLGDDPPVIGI
jgi:hypothetical protein